MSNILFMYDNLLDTATLTASSAASGFPADNLKNPFRTKPWRTAGSPAGVAQLVIDHGSAKAVDCIALIGYSWSAAPGKLMVEFNTADSWDNPAAREYLTWAANPTTNGNPGIIILKLSAARTYRYNRLSVVAASGVSLTYAASGSSGFSVPDNDNVDLYGSFTFVWRGKLDNWQSSPSVQWLFYTYQDNDHYALLGVRESTYKLSLEAKDGTTQKIWASSIGNSLAPASVHTIVCVYTVGAVNTTVDYYIDGVLFGTQVSNTAIGALANTAAKYFAGSASSRVASTTEFVALYNRPLSAAEVLSLHNSGNAPLIADVDKWGSEISLITGDNSTFASDTGWWTRQQDSITIADGVAHFTAVANGIRLYKSGLLTVGKKYKLVYTIKNFSAGGCKWGGQGYYEPAREADGTYTIEFVADDTILMLYAVGTTTLDIDDVTLYTLGCTGAWEVDGINSTNWLDSSTNDLDASYPAAGCTVNGAADWDLGRIFIGSYFEPAAQHLYGHTQAIVDDSMLAATIGGQDHADEVTKYRNLAFSFNIRSQAQWELFQKMINAVGKTKDLLIAMDYTNEPDEMTIYGKFTELPTAVGVRSGQFDAAFAFRESR